MNKTQNNRYKSSVVLCTYNGAQYIVEQLQSIIEQTIKPNQIVISDDHSTDNTMEIIKQFIDTNREQKIEFVLTDNPPENRGVTGNFENGIKHANGEIIFLSDQDDVWHKEKIASVMSVFNSHEDANVVVHNAQFLKKSTEGFDVENLFFYGLQSKAIGDYLNKDNVKKLLRSDFLNLVLQTPLINGMCMAIKNDYAHSIMPFPKKSIHDHWIAVCAIADDSLYAVNQCLAYYRIHDKNVCGIAEVNIKRKSFVSKMKEYDVNSQKSIQERFFWSRRVLEFLKDSKELIDADNQAYYFFMSDDRIKFLRSSKIPAICLLRQAYKRKCYLADGKAPFLHDIGFCLYHTKKNRIKILEKLLK